MRGATAACLALILATGGALSTGCHDNNPPPPRVPVPVPASEAPIVRRDDGIKPLPPPPRYEEQGVAPLPPAPPFDDAPLISQQPPEQPAFLDAYKRVGQPRIVVFVNRTLEGNIVPVTRDSVSSDRNHKYLRPGQYDDASAGDIDYEAIENIMTDWLACNGQVTIISPTMARQRLSDQQVKELQEGRPQAMSELVQELGADVLVQVQAHPTRQTAHGLEVRLIGEAMNVKGGQSLGRAVEDIPSPMEKTTINRYTRFMARKLMDEMTGAWLAPPPPDTSAPPATGASVPPPPMPPQIPPSTQP